jgi:DtxR family Mn-dependent transcriptional regulator
LKPSGRERALHIVRAHRIWERHLADRTGVEEELWHDEAERVEHHLSPSEVRDLSAELGHPTFDPHGDPIPPEGAGLWPIDGAPMTSLEAGDHARIVHLEDEPPAVYARLVAEGLTIGMEVHILDKSPESIRFWADGHLVVLAPITAANVTVRILQKQARDEPEQTVTLWDVAPGRQATVTSISKGCRGLMRRRLLDLGMVPGTVVTVERAAPGGDPVAYRVRGATIALRENQARFIYVEPVVEPEYS